jgi:hypothetical protein
MGDKISRAALFFKTPSFFWDLEKVLEKGRRLEHLNSNHGQTGSLAMASTVR